VVESRSWLEPTLSNQSSMKSDGGKGQVTAELDGVRLDKVLPALFPDLSRTRARSLIQRGAVRVNGRRLKVASRGLKTGDRVQWVDDPVVAKMPSKGLDIVHWGPGYVVVRKEPNQLVQGSPAGDQGSLERLLRPEVQAKSKVPAKKRPGKGKREGARSSLHVVHRLDGPAQGLVVFATHKSMAAHLSRQLQDRTLHRVYWALVEGIPSALKGTIDMPLSKVSGGRVYVDPAGREARTRWRALKVFPTLNLSLLELTLETGRTHQIRAHLAEVIGPIVGDHRYGARGWSGLRLAAVELSFHQLNGKLVEFRKSPPDSFFSENLTP